MKTVIAATSDQHINATIALCKPYVQDDFEGGSHVNSAVQNWLWSCQLDFNDRVRRAIVGAKFYDVYVGDVGEFDAKERTTQMISKNPAIIHDIVTETTAERRAMADRVFVIHGTNAHGGINAHEEESLAKDWGAEKCEATGRYSWKAWTAEIEGVYLEFSHHPAKRNARAQADYILREYSRFAHRVPRLAVYGHYHKYDDSLEYMQICRSIMLPAWCVATDHTFRIGRGLELADIGGLIITLENGRVDVDPVLYHPARPDPWRDHD